MSGPVPSFDVFRDSETGLEHGPKRRSGFQALGLPAEAAWDARTQAMGCAVYADAWGRRALMSTIRSRKTMKTKKTSKTMKTPIQ